MKKYFHTKCKSDTDFHSNKMINDDISGSLKIFQNNLLKELKNDKQNENNEKKGYNHYTRNINNNNYNIFSFHKRFLYF